MSGTEAIYDIDMNQRHSGAWLPPIPKRGSPDSQYNAMDRKSMVMHKDIDALKQALSKPSGKHQGFTVISVNGPPKRGVPPKSITQTEDGRLIASIEVAQQVREWLSRG